MEGIDPEYVNPEYIAYLTTLDDEELDQAVPAVTTETCIEIHRLETIGERKAAEDIILRGTANMMAWMAEKADRRASRTGKN